MFFYRVTMEFKHRLSSGTHHLLGVTWWKNVAREWVSFCKNRPEQAEAKTEIRIHSLPFATWNYSSLPGPWWVTMQLQEQQRSLGSSVGRAEVSRLSKITLSFPGCLLKIPWECLSGRIKVILIPYKKRTTPFTSKDERSVTDIDKE